MLGARDDKDALIQAQRHTSEPVTADRLERWNGTEYKGENHASH